MCDGCKERIPSKTGGQKKKQKLLNTGSIMEICHQVINKQIKNMEIGNSADIYEDSGINPLLNEMELEKYFTDKDYGNSEVKLFFVINCLLSHIKERRPRFDSKRNVLDWDIMLDYEITKKNTLSEKKNSLAKSIINSFDVLDKYKKLNLNKEAIKEDAKKYFEELGWVK